MKQFCTGVQRKAQLVLAGVKIEHIVVIVKSTLWHVVCGVNGHIVTLHTAYKLRSVAVTRIASIYNIIHKYVHLQHVSLQKWQCIQHWMLIHALQAGFAYNKLHWNNETNHILWSSLECGAQATSGPLLYPCGSVMMYYFILWVHCLPRSKINIYLCSAI